MTPRARALIVLATVAVALLGYYTFWLLRDRFRPWQVVRTRFAKVIGLKEKDPVLLQGATVGRVKSVDFSLDSFLATLELEPFVVVRRCMRAEIQTNPFGGAHVDLFEEKKDTAKHDHAVLGEREEIPGSYAGSIGAVDARSTANLHDGLKSLASGTDAILRGDGGLIGALLSGERMKEGFKAYLEGSRRLGSSLGETTRSWKRGEGLGALVDKKVANDARDAAASVKDALAGARLVVTDLGSPDGGFGGDAERGRSLRETTRQVAGALAVYRGVEAPRSLASAILTRDEVMYERLSGAAETFARSTAAAVRGEGAIGALFDEEGGRTFRRRLAALNEGFGDALGGRGGNAALLEPHPDRRRAVEELVGRIRTVLNEMRGAVRGLRGSAAVNSLHGAVFTVF